MIIHCLSMTQPWATLVMLEEKRWETRSWNRTYRGPLVIHAAKMFPRWAKDLCDQEPFAGIFRDHQLDVHRLPLGKLLGTVTMKSCRSTQSIRNQLTVQELALGDYSSGRWAFEFAEVHRFATSIPMIGQRGLFSVDIELSKHL